MPIDENILEQKTSQLHAKYKELRQQCKAVSRIENGLNGIKMVRDEVTVDVPGEDRKENQMVTVMPRDWTTDEEFTPAKRQQVHDTLMAQADAILNG